MNDCEIGLERSLEMVLSKKDLCLKFILISNIALKWLNGALVKRQTSIAKNEFKSVESVDYIINKFKS